MKYPELKIIGKCPYCEKELYFTTRFSGPTFIKVDDYKDKDVSYMFIEISCQNCKRKWTMKDYYEIEKIED